MPEVNLFGNPISVNNRGPYQGFIDQGIRFENIVQIQPMPGNIIYWDTTRAKRSKICQPMPGNIIYWDYEEPRPAPKCALERVAGPDFL